MSITFDNLLKVIHNCQRLLNVVKGCNNFDERFFESSTTFSKVGPLTPSPQKRPWAVLQQPRSSPAAAPQQPCSRPTAALQQPRPKSEIWVDSHTNPCKFLQFLADSCNFLQILAGFDRFWQVLAEIPKKPLYVGSRLASLKRRWPWTRRTKTLENPRKPW